MINVIAKLGDKVYVKPPFEGRFITTMGELGPVLSFNDDKDYNKVPIAVWRDTNKRLLKMFTDGTHAMSDGFDLENATLFVRDDLNTYHRHNFGWMPKSKAEQLKYQEEEASADLRV